MIFPSGRLGYCSKGIPWVQKVFFPVTSACGVLGMRLCLLIPAVHANKNPFLIRLIVKLADNNNSITYLNVLETAKSNSIHFSISPQGKLTERIRLRSPVGNLVLNYNASIPQRPLSQTVLLFLCEVTLPPVVCPVRKLVFARMERRRRVCRHMCANRCVFHLADTSTFLPN